MDFPKKIKIGPEKKETSKNSKLGKYETPEKKCLVEGVKKIV